MMPVSVQDLISPSQPERSVAMPENPRGAGVLFYDRRTQRVLLVRRDNIPTIPFPGHLDILGGHTEPGESPEQTVVREIAEELEDLRRGSPFVLTGHRLFTVYTDARGVTDSVFCKEADFTLADVRLKEGQELVWVTEAEVRATPLAFGYNAILEEFFPALRAGRV
jgi:8-oxo-dGTP diphosphatase